MHLIPTLRNPKQEDGEFKAMISYLVSFRPVQAAQQGPTSKKV